MKDITINKKEELEMAMKEKYDVSLEELIYEYDIKNEKEKGA